MLHGFPPIAQSPFNIAQGQVRLGRRQTRQAGLQVGSGIAVVAQSFPHHAPAEVVIKPALVVFKRLTVGLFGLFELVHGGQCVALECME